jgi:hypothetical protein
MSPKDALLVTVYLMMDIIRQIVEANATTSDVHSCSDHRPTWEDREKQAPSPREKPLADTDEAASWGPNRLAVSQQSNLLGLLAFLCVRFPLLSRTGRHNGGLTV